MMTDDDIAIIDPEAEYFLWCPGWAASGEDRSHQRDYINPMDLNLNYSEEDDPLTLKSDFILSLCELIVGGKEGLKPVEKTIIDRCVRMVYQDYLIDPEHTPMPILGDLYDLLRQQTEPEAQVLATALEITSTVR